MILDMILRQKSLFDVNKQTDVDAYAKFLKTGSWNHTKGCPFILEFPYLTVPDMIKDKLIHKLLKVKKRS